MGFSGVFEHAFCLVRLIGITRTGPISGGATATRQGCPRIKEGID